MKIITFRKFPDRTWILCVDKKIDKNYYVFLYEGAFYLFIKHELILDKKRNPEKYETLYLAKHALIKHYEQNNIQEVSST